MLPRQTMRSFRWWILTTHVESHLTPLYRLSVLVDTRDLSRVNTSLDILSDKGVPEVFVELPVTKRVTGLFPFFRSRGRK